MRVTFHDGELERYAVRIRCVSHPKLKQNDENIVLVFAMSSEGAKLAAIDKAQDKWLRHRNKQTVWVTVGEPWIC